MNVNKGTIAWVYFIAIVLLVGFVVLLVLLQSESFVADSINTINEALGGGVS